MNESRWEASRRSARKNGIVILLVLVGVSAIIGVLIVNNRDQMAYQPAPESTAAEKKVPVGILPTHDSSAAAPVTAKTVGAVKLTQPSPETTAAPAHPSLLLQSPSAVLPERLRAAPVARQQAGVPPSLPPAKVAAKVKIIPPQEGGVLQSVRLPMIRCSAESRKDVVIYLSLELFFTDAGRRSSVLLRRDDIKVMVMKALRGKELSEITTGRLESELLKEINQLFDHGEIVAVKISDIRIEKAVKE